MSMPVLNLFRGNARDIEVGFKPLGRDVAKSYKIYASNKIDTGYVIIRNNIWPYINKKLDLQSIIIKLTRQQIADALSITEDINDLYYLKITYVDTSDVEQPISLSDTRPVIVLSPRRVKDTFYRNYELTITHDTTYADNIVDFEWDLGRSIDKLTVATSGSIRIKFNDEDNDYITLFANEEKTFDGDGLEIKKIYIDNKDAGYGADVSVRMYAVSTFMGERERSWRS